MKLVSSLLFTFLVTVLAAQEAPKKDPFIKDKKKTEVQSLPLEQIRDVACLLESFILPQADFAAWLEAPGGREKLHEKVLAAVKAGTAKLDACHFARGAGGTRFTLESVDELIYPTEWSLAGKKGFQYPMAFEMSQTGDRLEMEPTVDPSSTIVKMTQSFVRVRFSGLRASKADRTQPGVVVADFHEQRCPSKKGALVQMPTLLSSHAVGAGQVLLTFITPRVPPITPPAQLPSLVAGNLTLTPRVISLDRTRAWELLRTHAESDTALLAALKPMLADKSAVLEYLATVSGETGVRMEHETVRPHFYGTEFNPPEDGEPAKQSDDPQKPGIAALSNGYASTKAFEARPIGFHWQAEMTADEKRGIIQTNIALEYTGFMGNLNDPLWSEHYPEVPVFSSQRITTGYSQAAGSTILLSTLNPPGDTGVNGRKDEGRVWLLFLEASLE
ncbi:MAG: hypothetical protein IPK32_07750 [Verrucomicrobiaceae bacterium]|nr:hypothetical protein [Verrucomicrobiaceae bacterium]